MFQHVFGSGAPPVSLWAEMEPFCPLPPPSWGCELQTPCHPLCHLPLASCVIISWALLKPTHKT